MSDTKFYKESHFSNTEIGRIPKQWEVRRLGDEQVAEIRGNKSINKFNEVAFIPMEAIPDSGIFVNFEIRSIKDVKSFTYCEKGDILLAKITPSLENGKQGIIPDNVPNGFALATTEVFPIKCKNTIERLYLFYILKHPKFRNKIIASMTGTTGRQRASKKSVESLPIPRPPLPEQKAIARVLKDFDDLIEVVDRQIKTLQRIKKGFMNVYFTKGIFEHKEFKDTEIGRIPKEWEVRRLGEVVDINPENIDPEKSFKNSHFLYVDIDSIEKENGWCIYPKRIKGEESPSRARRLIKKGDVLLSTVRPYLKGFAIVPEFLDGFVCSTGFSVLRAKKNLYNVFLLYTLFSNRLVEQYFKFMSGANYPALTNQQVENLLIPRPPLPEQKAIAQRLLEIDNLIENRKKEKKKIERAKKKVMDMLLSGRVRVRVNKNEG